MNNVASGYLGMKRYAEAETAYVAILKLADGVLKARRESIAATYNNLGILYYKTKKFSKSEEMLLTALSMKKQVWGPSHNDVGLTLRNLSRLYRLRDQPEKAAKLEAEANAILGQDPDGKTPSN
jgi:tetratricopeptide (TPR) repeat protein